MASDQPLMDINPDSEPQYTTPVEPEKESKCILANSNEKGLSYMDDCAEIKTGRETLLNGEITVPEVPEEMEIDVIKCTSIGETRLVEADDPDATEYSSSFGNSESDAERCSGLSEAEVESQYFDDSGLGSSYDSFSSMFPVRKKKLTNHWRNFIRPIMWRCKWVELKIKEIESQALKYARELALYDQRKFSRINQDSLEGFGSKSLPFSSQCYRKKPMKRRRRKRVEDTTELMSYISRHNLFSYLESKKANLDCNSMADDFGSAAIMDHQADCIVKFGGNDDHLFFKFKDSDNSLDQVLWKIELVHSRVHKLKSQLDKIMSKNASKFSSSENLSLLVPCEAQTSSAPSPTFSAGNADTTSVGAICNLTQHLLEYDLGELVMHESAISSYAETVHVPDIIESTVGLLSAADVTFHQPQIGDSCEDILDNILLQTDGAEGDCHTFLRTSNQSIDKHHEPEKGEGEGEGESTNPSKVPTSDDPVAKSAASQDQSTLKSCLALDFQFPRNKRKRGERKAGPGISWNRKGASEPDSL